MAGRAASPGALAGIGAGAATAGELFVVVACHDLVCAVATRWIARLLLIDEVEAPGADVVLVGGRRWAAWDLGRMLGLPPLDHAWVLLNVPHAGAELPIALRTGPCLTVQPIAAFTALPEGLFRARRGALPAAFPASEIKGRTDALFGLCFDPARAWTSTELENSVRSISPGEVLPP
jgi:hypothetical protein